MVTLGVKAHTALQILASRSGASGIVKGIWLHHLPGSAGKDLTRGKKASSKASKGSGTDSAAAQEDEEDDTLDLTVQTTWQNPHQSFGFGAHGVLKGVAYRLESAYQAADNEELERPSTYKAAGGGPEGLLAVIAEKLSQGVGGPALALHQAAFAGGGCGFGGVVAVLKSICQTAGDVLPDEAQAMHARELAEYAVQGGGALGVVRVLAQEVKRVYWATPVVVPESGGASLTQAFDLYTSGSRPQAMEAMAAALGTSVAEIQEAAATAISLAGAHTGPAGRHSSEEDATVMAGTLPAALGEDVDDEHFIECAALDPIVELLDASKPQDAIPLLEAVLASNAEHAPASFLLATALFLDNRWLAAEEQARRTLGMAAITAEHRAAAQELLGKLCGWRCPPVPNSEDEGEEL